MRILAVIGLLSLLLLSGCGEQDPNAYYTCFGGVKVQSLDDCDFSSMNARLEGCDKVLVYETSAIVTGAEDVVPAFNIYAHETGSNLSFVSSEYYSMVDGMDHYRFNFYDYEARERKQYFIDYYGRVFRAVNCVT